MIDAPAELRAALETCALFDRSDLGRIRASGKDILDLLHRLSTADLRGLEPGRGRPTVLTTAKGRIVARLFAHHAGEDGVWLLAGPNQAGQVKGHVDRFTFAEDTRLADETEATRQFSVVGPLGRSALASLGAPAPEAYGTGSARIAGIAVRILGQDGFSADGVSIVVPTAGADATRDALSRAVASVGGRTAGAAALEAWRVLRGHPAPGHELTEERNPLEAGLLDAVSFTKGCYVGQEVLARLRTYDKVSRTLIGISLEAGPEPPAVHSRLFRDGREVGEITTAILPPGRTSPVALGFVRRDAAAPGTELRVGGSESATRARVAALPFEDAP